MPKTPLNLAEIPLGEAFDEFYSQRQAHQLGIAAQMASQVYATQDRKYIADWEQDFADFVAATQGELEKLTQQQEPKSTKPRKRKRRPLATAENYQRAVKQGLTKEQFEKRYRVKSNLQYCGWARHHGSLAEE